VQTELDDVREQLRQRERQLQDMAEHVAEVEAAEASKREADEQQCRNAEATKEADALRKEADKLRNEAEALRKRAEKAEGAHKDGLAEAEKFKERAVAATKEADAYKKRAEKAESTCKEALADAERSKERAAGAERKQKQVCARTSSAGANLFSNVPQSTTQRCLRSHRTPLAADQLLHEPSFRKRSDQVWKESSPAEQKVYREDTICEPEACHEGKCTPGIENTSADQRRAAMKSTPIKCLKRAAKQKKGRCTRFVGENRALKDQVPLPPTWVQLFSEEERLPYYWNEVRQIAAWVRPTA